MHGAYAVSPFHLSENWMYSDEIEYHTPSLNRMISFQGD